jgi:hypothetical protein
MTSRELSDWLRTRDASEDTVPDQAGQANWRHRLMSMGHDPLKPA